MMSLSSDRAVCLALFAVCAASLSAALFLEYGMGVLPCILCLWQRVPYAVAGGLGLFGLLPGLSPRLRRGLVALAGIAFLVNMGVAVFHVGVEQHWWAGTAQCTAPAGGAPQSLADLQAALENPPELARCDEVGWSLFGISLPGYNIVFSLCLGVATLMAAARSELWRRR